jgi:hypothetical protein
MPGGYPRVGRAEGVHKKEGETAEERTPSCAILLRLPPSLETLLSEKRFLSAVVLLVRCNKALRKWWGVGGVSE